MLFGGSSNKSNRIIILSALCLLSIFIFFIVKICRTKPVNNTYLSDSLTFNPDDSSYSINQIPVPNGVYDITIKYQSSSDVRTSVSTNWGLGRFLLSDNPTLSCNENSGEFSIWISDKCDQINISTYSDTSDYKIDSIVLSTSSISKTYQISKLAFIFIFIIIIIVIYFKRDKVLPRSFPYGLVILIAFLASIGLFNSYLINGHDLNYHLLRIEGLKEALINGSFPDKVQTNWCYGWGYAVSAMYGDMILLPSAILRLLGFPLITCYKLYIILINLGTAFSSYYAFNKISKNRLNSVLVSFLYTCAPYRLCCIYIRSAMGEYSAFLFFPLIILAFYYMFEENDTPEYGKRILLPSLGFAGLLQTHILSCIMSSIFIIIYLIVNYKKLICRKRLIYIAKIAVSSVLLSVWFLIPFLRFSREPLIVYSDSSWNYEIQWYGASISELFAQIAGPSTNFNFAYNTGLTERMPLSIGNGLVTILILFLCFRNKMNSKNTGTIKICTLLGCLSAFLCSIYFPYNKLHDLLPKLSGFISTIQFPYRFISTTVVLLSVASVLILNNLALSINKHTFHLLICIVFIIGFHQSISLLYNSIYHGSFITYYDSVNLRSNELMGYQYLYEGTDYSIPEREHEVTGNDSNIINVDNSSNSYIITCNSTGTDSFIELPLYYYPGYIAKDSDNNRLNIDRGSNNRIRVMLPEDFDGEITVKYSEPMIWHVMEMISLFTFFALIIYEIRSKKTNIKQENTPDGDDEKNLE